MSLNSRYYESQYPEVEETVIALVKSLNDMGAYVQLVEYNNIEGMILSSELSRRRIRSVAKLVRVGKMEPVMVMRVDKDKGYIDLSKRRVTTDEIKRCEERYSKAKLVQSIMRNLAEKQDIKLEEYQQVITWPLYKQYGHAFDGFKKLVSEPQDVWKQLTEQAAEDQKYLLNDEALNILTTIIGQKMTSNPYKIRANIELTCFSYDGIEHIKDALREAQKISQSDCEIRVKLIATPMYTVYTQTIDKILGVQLVGEACDLIKSAIEKNKGRMVVKEEAKAVSDRDEKLMSMKYELEGVKEGNSDEEEVDEDDEEDEHMPEPAPALTEDTIYS